VSIIPPFSAVKSLFVLKHSEANWNIHLAKKSQKKKTNTIKNISSKKNKLPGRITRKKYKNK
jgi:hypothetical protein